MKPHVAAGAILGGAVILHLLERASQKRPGEAERIAVPSELLQVPPPAPLPSAGIPAGPRLPRQLPTAGPVQVETGSRYLASIRVGFPLSILANASKVQSEAANQGFTDLAVTTVMPAGWPAARADYYVSGRYIGPTRNMERTGAGGQVNVVDVWQV